MEKEIKLGKKVFIRNVGKDEFWLQDLIYANPEKLGLGNLVAVNKEKRQVTGGRLDILLKDSDDNSMYEIEVMLGETDPSHIIRSIEYWDNEKRKYPQRQHFCILIAESFDRRYFNVIQILSLNIPMIAIQADLLEVDEEYVLNFSKIMDIYVELEDEEEATVVTEQTWSEKAKWTLGTAKKLLEIVAESTKNATFKFTQSYINIMIDGRNSYYLDKRTKPNSLLWFSVKDEEKEEAVRNLLNTKNIVYNFSNKYKEFSFTIEQKFITENKDILAELHDLRYKEYKIEE
ncbi:MAG: hypothetical protein P9L92_15530 [Candidatus Electryonea clarkiae]|nr:hypothetical protein [Candidatus Electryonea clarkiae]MDP8288441.1 hypothetical protein [Candidatus Electryonea clarkiae]